MKYFWISIILFLIVSCKQEERNIGNTKTYNPKNEISQILVNPEAEKLFENASEKNKLSEYDLAKALLERALLIEESPIIYNEIGITLMAQKKFDEAIKYYQKSIDFDPAYYPSYINLSWSYLKTENYNEGKKILIRLISNTESEYWKANGNLYLAYFYFTVDKDCQKARYTLEKATLLESDSSIGWQYTELMNNIDKTCR